MRIKKHLTFINYKQYHLPGQIHLEVNPLLPMAYAKSLLHGKQSPYGPELAQYAICLTNAVRVTCSYVSLHILLSDSFGGCFVSFAHWSWNLLIQIEAGQEMSLFLFGSKDPYGLVLLIGACLWSGFCSKGSSVMFMTCFLYSFTPLVVASIHITFESNSYNI